MNYMNLGVGIDGYFDWKLLNIYIDLQCDCGYEYVFAGMFRSDFCFICSNKHHKQRRNWVEKRNFTDYENEIIADYKVMLMSSAVMLNDFRYQYTRIVMISRACEWFMTSGSDYWLDSDLIQLLKRSDPSFGHKYRQVDNRFVVDCIYDAMKLSA